MVKDAERRKRHYEAKIDGETTKRAIDKQKPDMVMSQAEYMNQITRVEQNVKALVEKTVSTSLEVRDYLNFSREVFELRRRFSGKTLSVEAQLKVDKWSSRGLDPDLLIKVAELCGVTPESASEEDVLKLKAGKYSPNNNGIEVIAGEEGKKITVYHAGYRGQSDGEHYFYFGTSTSLPEMPSSKIFMYTNKAEHVRQTFVEPLPSAEGESLYIASSVSETNMPLDLSYKQK